MELESTHEAGVPRHPHDGHRRSHHSDKMKTDLITRLNRIEGQIRGIKGMIEKNTYCDHVLNQISAVQAAWFVLIAVLFAGFFFLEGFDFGVGMSTRWLAKGNMERRVLINTIGPFWDANEVWLITAAGAMFAAFPHWYSTMFSGYYVPLTLILLALIGRAAAFEFRGKAENERWRRAWDFVVFAGSLAPPFLFG